MKTNKALNTSHKQEQLRKPCGKRSNLFLCFKPARRSIQFPGFRQSPNLRFVYAIPYICHIRVMNNSNTVFDLFYVVTTYKIVEEILENLMRVPRAYLRKNVVKVR